MRLSIQFRVQMRYLILISQSFTEEEKDLPLTEKTSLFSELKVPYRNVQGIGNYAADLSR